jgi:hypothetical protein
VDLHDVVLPVHVEDSLGLLIESPLSMLGMIWSPSSEINPVVSVHCDDSLHWHSRSDVEWSVNVETEFFVESFSFNSISFVKIDDSPFLVSLAIVSVNSNSLSFNILGSFHFKYSVILHVDELIFLELENLEPSGVGAPDLHI